MSILLVDSGLDQVYVNHLDSDSDHISYPHSEHSLAQIQSISTNVNANKVFEYPSDHSEAVKDTILPNSRPKEGYIRKEGYMNYLCYPDGYGYFDYPCYCPCSCEDSRKDYASPPRFVVCK